MSTYSSPTDVVSATKVLAADLNGVDAATATAFGLVPDETKMYRGTVNFGTDTGAADAYVVTVPYTPSYVDGLLVSFIPLATNTTASTINVNGLGVKSIRLPTGAALSAALITVGVPVDVRYSTVTGFFHLVGVLSPQGIPGPAGGVTSINVSGGTTGFTVSGGPITTNGTLTLAGTLSAANGGTGVANNAAATLTRTGNYDLNVTLSAASGVTFPVTGTLATKDGTETFTNKTLTAPVINSPTGIVKADVGLNLAENTALSTWAGTANITTLGTIATGTWSATTIAVNKGGTGATTLTANNVILGNGTSAVAFVAPGTSGNVLTSNGTTWASSTPPNGLTLIAQSTASSSATIDFTSGITSSYDVYELHVVEAVPATNTVTAELRTSVDGVTWNSSSGDYDWSLVRMSGPTNLTGSTTATFIQLTEGASVGNTAAAGGISGVIRFYNPAGTSVNKRFDFFMSSGSGTGAPAALTGVVGMGARVATAAITGIRFLFSSGNIASGKFKLYGVQKS